MRIKLCQAALIFGTIASATSYAANLPDAASPLHALAIAVGHWQYHGETLAVAGQKAGSWVWDEDCGWSANQAFMACSFTMNDSGKIIKSHAVSTYNSSDQSYWHYEMFDSDGSGAEPFIARMSIAGNTWTSVGKADHKSYRVIYRYTSPRQVFVAIEMSDDEVHWTMVAHGEGVKH